MDLLAGFNHQCLSAPNRLAFSEAERSISYQQFQQGFQAVAAFLEQQACANSCIALLLERGILAASAVYGVLSASASYLPLDIKNPPERLNLIIEDAQPRLILGQGPCPAWLNARDSWRDISQLAPAPNYTPAPLDPEAIAAILYTSGSTGRPKGVALTHRAMHNFADWARLTFGLSADDRIASLAPFHFDLSVFDLFSSLAAGASVHFMPAQLTLAPTRLSHWLQTQEITCWYTVPSLLSFLALKGDLANTTLPKLRTLLFAGEVFPSAQLIRLAEQLPQVELYNLFGPTETNVCCYWPVERRRLQADQPIPIGIPACDAKLQIDPETGELLVDCPNNFAGYWQNGALHRISTDNAYRSGDRVSLNEFGEYCYHGRLDRMLKCSGYRVEPAEIEQIIRQSPLVEDCAVIGLPDPTSGQRPAAVIVFKAAHQLAQLLPSLKTQLPHYMQPTKVLVKEHLPRLSNGKIDYCSLATLFEKP